MRERAHTPTNSNGKFLFQEITRKGKVTSSQYSMMV